MIHDALKRIVKCYQKLKVALRSGDLMELAAVANFASYASPEGPWDK